MLIKRYTQPKRMFRFATHPRRARTRARGRPRPLGDSVTASPRGCLRLRPRANLGDTPIAACSQTASTLSPHVLREFERNKTPSSRISQPEFMPPLPLEVFKDVLLLLPAAGCGSSAAARSVPSLPHAPNSFGARMGAPYGTSSSAGSTAVFAASEWSRGSAEGYIVPLTADQCS